MLLHGSTLNSSGLLDSLTGRIEKAQKRREENPPKTQQRTNNWINRKRAQRVVDSVRAEKEQPVGMDVNISRPTVPSAFRHGLWCCVTSSMQ
jgi:hypothetical protein